MRDINGWKGLGNAYLSDCGLAEENQLHTAAWLRLAG
jgi:hypothetical protein